MFTRLPRRNLIKSYLNDRYDNMKDIKQSNINLQFQYSQLININFNVNSTKKAK